MAQTRTVEGPVFKALTVDKLDTIPESRQLRFVISTGAVDRDNDTIDPKGWDLLAYKANPVVLWAHSHKDLPIGKAVDIHVEGDALVATAEFATHPLAETVYQLLKGGFMKATSVGFRALDYALNEERKGVDFKRQELLEFSVVPVPANPQALVSAEAADISLDVWRKWIQDSIEAWPGELRLTGKAWRKVLGDMSELSEDATPTVPPQLTDDALADMRQRMDALEWRATELERSHSAAPTIAPPAEEWTLELDDDEDAFDFDPDALRAGLRDTVSDAVRTMVRDETQRALNRIRGRLD